MLSRLFIVISVTFIAPLACAMNLNMSPGCQEWLAPRWEQTMDQLRTILKGEGEVIVYTPTEFHQVMGLADPTPLRSRPAYLLLPESARHLFNTPATTYADNPTRQVAFGDQGAWLIVGSTKAPDQRPQHLVVMAHTINDSVRRFTGLHESVHLEDYDAIYNYARSRGPSVTVILRMDIFTLLTEMHAYRRQIQAMAADRTDIRLDVRGVAELLSNQYAGFLRHLPIRDWLPLTRVLGIRGFDAASLENYLMSEETNFPWSEILRTLPSTLLKEQSQ